MYNKIIRNLTLEQYNKKYRNRNEHLLKVTKKEIESFNNAHKNVDKYYLLENRKWALIGDTYYQLPTVPTYTWFRNLKKSTQIISTSVTGLAVAGGITAAVILNLPKPYVKTLDDKFVDQLNEVVDSNKSIKTLFNAVEYFKENKSINLEQVKAKDSNKEYAFDIDNREFLVLDKEGNVVYSPKPINSRSSVFRFSDKYDYDANVSNPSNVYGTYLTENAVTNAINRSVSLNNTFNDNDVELKFNTSLDVGYNKQYLLKFTPNSDFKPIVVTNKNDLEIDGTVDNVTHYGIAAQLTVTSLEGTYTERGTIEGEIKLSGEASTKFVAAEESVINTVIVDNKNVTVNAEKDSYIGTVAKTEKVQDVDLEKIVTKEEGAEIAKKEETAIDPEDRDFDGGFGRESSPYIIRSSDALVELSDKVNDTSTNADYADKHYLITKDIDLSKVSNFTPIGNSTNKFRGHVNGCESTISKMNCKQTVANCGLFGVIEGTENSHFQNKTHVWKDNAFYEDNITEDKYTCVVKNLNIANSNFEIEASAKKKQVGALAGTAFAVRIENVHFLSGTVKGYKAVGGLAGDLSCCAMINCSTGSDVTVTTDVYHVGGISGYTQSRIGDCSSGQAIVNTTNNAKIVCLNNESPGGGGAGGLCGYTNGGAVNKSLSIIGCVNNGEVTTNPDGGNKRPQYISGIVGYGHQGLELVANCTNNGLVNNKSTDTVDDMSGICSLGRAEFVNCVNNGDLVGKAKFKSGIIAGEANSSQFEQEVKNCVNNGKVIADGGKATPIAADTQNLKLSNAEFATTDELFDGLTSSIYTTHIYEFDNVNVKNPGTYNIASDVTYMTIKSNTKLFETFVMHQNIVSLDIDAQMGNVTLSNAPGAYITINSKNTVVTVPQNATIGHLTVKGEGSSVINNGTITNGVDLNGLSTKCVNNGTIGGLNIDSFDGTVTKEFINNGSVSSSQRHCMSITSNTGVCNLTIHNYGTIACTSTNNAHYLLLQYSKGHFDMYNYADSSVDCNGLMNGAHPGSYSGTGVFYHQTQDLGGKNPAKFTSEKLGDDWSALAWAGVYTVQAF